MTVVIAIACTDGLVMAGDSRATWFMEPARVLSDYTHKVFEIGGNAVATYGYAFLLGRNIAGNVAELRAGLGQETIPPKGLAERIAEFFGDRFERHIVENPQDEPSPGSVALGFLVAGYDGGRGHTFEVRLPGRQVLDIQDTIDRPGAVWRGQTDVIARLVKGLDFTALFQAVEEEGKQEAFEELLPILESLEYYMPFDSMNLQDAIDYAIFVIRTTIDTQRLTYGTLRRPGSWPGVGGPIEVAVLTASEGFRWLQRTDLKGERKAGEAENI